MAYATQADIEARYPGELAQAGPRDATGALDTDAIARACAAASETMDRTLRLIGWPAPLAVPAPDWVVDLVVDLALYLVTPTVLASQGDFSDRKARYQNALEHLSAIRRGEEIPAPPAGVATVPRVYVTSTPRQFGRGML